jgi:FtsZ-binding cell division protein ZapB
MSEHGQKVKEMLDKRDDEIERLKQERDAAIREIGPAFAEIERLREAGIGYSQQTMDAVVRERDQLRAEIERLKQEHERMLLGAWQAAILALKVQP